MANGKIDIFHNMYMVWYGAQYGMVQPFLYKVKPVI